MGQVTITKDSWDELVKVVMDELIEVKGDGDPMADMMFALIGSVAMKKLEEKLFVKKECK